MATTNYRLARTAGVSQRGQTPRRGMLPISGLMIILGVLMLGSALAIPASRAMQEAEMRERIASFSESEHFESSVPAGDPLPSDENPDTDASAIPAFAEIEDSESDSEASEGETASEGDGSGASNESSPIDGSNESSEESESASEQEASPEPTPVDMPDPTHIRIPDVGIDTEIDQVGYDVVDVQGYQVREWEVAEYAAGHHKTSAAPGEGGNVVITGHNDWRGEVFRTLEYVEPGYEVFIETEDGEHAYVIEEIHMRREVGVSMEERLATGEFMAEMPEERVTLITCWPYGVNDHRVIVVAKPVD